MKAEVNTETVIVTNVTLSLTKAEASRLMSILSQCVRWSEAPAGALAEDLYREMAKGGLREDTTTFTYNSDANLFVQDTDE